MFRYGRTLLRQDLFWDHEQEPENPDDMSNMYFLANDINEFLDNLYEDIEE